MAHDASEREDTGAMSRRMLITGLAGAAGLVALAPGRARAQAPPAPVGPPTVITNPPRDFGPGGAPAM